MPTNVVKISIEPFSDAKMTQSAGQAFTIPINPEQFSEKRQLKYDTKKGVGNQGTNAKYGGTEPEELKLDFTLDGTGAVEGNALHDKDVPEQVKMLLETAYTMKSEIHKPRFLKLHWGEHFTFPCVLTGLDITYTLFNREGLPLRAKVSAVFLNYIEEEKRIRQEDKKSPDLTHTHSLVQGDRLDLLVHQFYGDSRYMPQVARLNGLTSLRKVRVGQPLLFPPFATDEIAQTGSHLEP